MDIVYAQDAYVRDWVAHQLGQVGFAGNAMNAFGVAENGALIGGTAFHNYYPKEGVVEMSSASVSSRWLTRKMIHTIFSYAFDLLGCQLVVMRVSIDNSRMMNIARRFGFNIYTIPRLRGRMEAEAVCTYTDDQWADSPFNIRRLKSAKPHLPRTL